MQPTPQAPIADPSVTVEALNKQMGMYRDFKINYETGRAEKIIGDYRLIINFPAGKNNPKDFHAHLDKFNETNVQKIIEIITKMPIGQEKQKKNSEQKYAFTGYTFLFTAEGKVEIGKKYRGKDTKVLTNAKTHYEAKLKLIPTTVEPADIAKTEKIKRKLEQQEKINAFAETLFSPATDSTTKPAETTV